MLEEAAAHGEHLRHRALRHAIGPRGQGSQRLLGDLALALGDTQAEGAPVLVQKIGIGVLLLAAAYPQEARLDHRTDPVGRGIEAELHERFGIAAAQLQQRFVRHQQRPEQQSLDVGPVGIERGLVARIGLQESPSRTVAFDSLTFRGEAQEELANHRQLAAQVQEIEFMEAIEGLEQGLRGVRHGGSFLGNYGCAAQYMQYPGLAVIGY